MKVAAFVCIALAVFVGTCSATNYTFSAKYVMRNSDVYSHGFVDGTVYYHYDDATVANSRVRFETKYIVNGKEITSTELYHYKNSGIYTMCEVCTAAHLGNGPEPWGKTALDHCNKEGDYYRCTRESNGAHGVAELVVKSELGAADYDIKYIKFNDGTELELSGYKSILYTEEKFELPENFCPAPECRSYVDIVFIMDSSTSVNDKEWGQALDFVSKAIRKFTVGPNDAYIGVVIFSAPDSTCTSKDCLCSGRSCTGWWNKCCNNGYLQTKSVKLKSGGYGTRYIDDCLFDKCCNNKTDTTAKILMELSSADVVDKVTKLKKMEGHTCQRYGLQKAYDMLFTNNPRCQNGVNCPTPIVIVVTDGEDLCHTSTKEWAEKIKAKDDRGILLEVGVGLQAVYDEDYIRELSSNLTGYEAALTVDDYSQINTILDKMITPVCEVGQSGGSCGPNCHGYCACGECVCPECADGEDMCHYYECNTPENGCQNKTYFCSDPELEATQCYDIWCDPAATSVDIRCKNARKNCTAEIEKQGYKFKGCEYVECTNRTGGCSKDQIRRNNAMCQNLAPPCKTGKCDPANSVTDDGCVFEDVDCKSTSMGEICKIAQCEVNHGVGECRYDQCESACVIYDNVTGEPHPRCPESPCTITTCDPTEGLNDSERCSYNYTCDNKNLYPDNMCKIYDCQENECVTIPVDGGCDSYDNKCFTFACDPNANGGAGGCVATPTSHVEDVCMLYTCDNETGWTASPKCTSTLACKIARCNAADGGSCYEVDVSCNDKVNITDKCFQASCKEPTGCYKKQYRGAYFDICGNCIRTDALDGSSVATEEATDCVEAPDEDIGTEGLAAAAIALIVLAAIIIGAAIAVSGVLGTKALIDRARGANNQSVVSNPLFEDSQTEMSNPAFIGDTV